jgi:NitT/TauT family transport system ATP-binding protein
VTPAFLSCTGLSKRFPTDGGSVEVLREVSFDQARGEVVALLGPSGCGKSTLLRIVAGLETATQGAVTVGGVPVIGPGRDRGMVFQAYTAFDWMTVRQNVEFGLRLRGLPAATCRAKAERFIGLVQLTRFADAYPATLSGGMKQRLAIARSFANEPDIILMDEPFGALDSETRWAMQELLVTVVRETGATVLLVTHDLEEAIFLADRIVFLAAHPGRVQEIIPVARGWGASARKEDLLDDSGYRALHRHLMAAMRRAGGSTDAEGG